MASHPRKFFSPESFVGITGLLCLSQLLAFTGFSRAFPKFLTLAPGRLLE